MIQRLPAEHCGPGLCSIGNACLLMLRRWAGAAGRVAKSTLDLSFRLVRLVRTGQADCASLLRRLDASRRLGRAASAGYDSDLSHVVSTAVSRPGWSRSDMVYHRQRHSTCPDTGSGTGTPSLGMPQRGLMTSQATSQPAEPSRALDDKRGLFGDEGHSLPTTSAGSAASRFASLRSFQGLGQAASHTRGPQMQVEACNCCRGVTQRISTARSGRSPQQHTTTPQQAGSWRSRQGRREAGTGGSPGHGVRTGRVSCAAGA